MDDIMLDQVFKNRGKYEEEGYIERDTYETDLYRSLNRYKYVFVTGESGCGKTWLYTHVAIKQKIKYQVINLAEIMMKGGFYNYFKSLFSERVVEKTELKSVEINGGVFGGNLEENKTIEVVHDYFKMFLDKNKDTLIVFENFEIIISERNILESLSCIITMADDPIMLNSNTKFLFVGAINDYLSYFSKISNYQTIANRIQHLHIKGFNDTECYNFVTKRYKKCGFEIEEPNEFTFCILDCTDGIPQSVNELCYFIALSHYKKNEIKICLNTNAFTDGKKAWISQFLLAEYSLIRDLFYKNKENLAYLNYVLYVISEQKLKLFTAERIVATIDSPTFVEIRGKQITYKRVKKYLDELSDDGSNKNILLKYNDEYRIKSYKTYRCLKLVIIKKDGQVYLEGIGMDCDECFVI